MREEKNLTDIRLTESDEDGIWLHFEAGEYSAGVALSSLLGHGDIINRTMEDWARRQLDKQEITHRRFYLKQPVKLGTRPSSPVEGGY